MINAALEVDRLAEAFSIHRKVIVDDFLDNTVATKWEEHLSHLPSVAWTVSTWPKAGMELPNHPDHKRFHSVIQSRARKVALEGEYARFFTRITGDHHTDEVFEEIVTFFASPEMRHLVERITNTSIAYTNPAIAYNYEPGSFIAEHRDKGDGRTTYVFHLSQNWQPEWGGHFEDLSDPDNVSSIVPRFNRLVLFDMTNQRLPHRVTAVVDDAPQNRYSVSGWYK